MIKAVFATDLAGGFGHKGGLPWPSIKEDMKHFMNVTKNTHLAMGYSTYKTLPVLKGRPPIVVLDISRGVPAWEKEPMYTSFDSFIADALWLESYNISDVSIIGGTSLLIPKYLESCAEIYRTTIKGVYEADVYMPSETMLYLSTLTPEIILDTECCIVRKYT
jgi:dihydrofolate reductase